MSQTLYNILAKNDQETLNLVDTLSERLARLEKKVFGTKKVKVLRMDNGVKLPVRAHLHDAGFDLYANQEIRIKGGERRLIPTGIKMQIPNGYVGLIWPKSGLAVKFGIDTMAGVIDAPYRGEIQVCLINTTTHYPLFETPDDVAVEFKKGDKIAQILIQELPNVKLEEVSSLDETERGENGFGSTGT